MKKFLFIGLGGFIGAMGRYAVKSVHMDVHPGNLPFDTLVINVAGSFLLGLIMTIALEIWEIDSEMRLGITTGLLGAFTTFSTLSLETLVMLQEGHYVAAISYMAASVIFGLSAAYLGIATARKAVANYGRDADNDLEEDGSGA